jgi:hypothetical protein
MGRLETLVNAKSDTLPALYKLLIIIGEVGLEVASKILTVIYL